MNHDLILDRLTNNIIAYTMKTREKVFHVITYLIWETFI